MTTLKLIRRVPALLAAAALAAVGCTDERTAPTTPEAPSYNETMTLFTMAPASGQDMAGSFTVRDNLASGLLAVTCYFEPDPDLLAFEAYGREMDSLNSAIDSLNALRINLELQDTISHADSLKLDSLNYIMGLDVAGWSQRFWLRDSLDTYLDDRFAVAVWLDADSVEFYPWAVILDADACPYLGTETAVWGQGTYRAVPDNDPAGDWRGRTLRLNLDEFWVADGGWDIGGLRPNYNAKPVRASRYPDQYPLRDWRTRITPGGSHTIHIRFGSPATSCKVTASLYAVYDEEG